METDEVLVNESFYQSVGTIYSVGVMTENASVQQALYAAIGSNNLEAVQQIIRTGTAPAPTDQTAGDVDDNMPQGGDVTIIN